jgi:signal transduction histidine kinase
VKGNLFIKMFVAFWVVTCAVLGSWMLASNYFEDQPAEVIEETSRPRGPPQRFMLRAIYELQNLEIDELEDTLAHAKRRHRVDIYLLPPGGEDIFGKVTPERVSSVSGQLQQGRRRVFVKSPQGRLVGHEIYRRDGGVMHAVFQFPPHQRHVLGILGSSPGLRLLLAILISGLICYALSRLLTTRLKALQTASRQLANGDLETRLQVRERGGDETDELARDFNSMAEQLEARIESQRRLLSDVSHELRSPLARLRIALALAQDDPDGRANHLSRIEHESERLEELIAQLLSSNIQDIEMDTHIDIVALLEALCKDAEFEGQPEHVTVRLTPGAKSVLVKSSADLLQKCFENILRNAIAHSPANSVVQVTLDTNDSKCVVSISDQGPGVPEDALEEIFETFYRVDTARARETGGYGLGLSIARRAVLQHRGTITARNLHPGLQVTVTLPTDG